MKLSTKGRYGLKAMFELSLTHSKGPVSIKTIAAKQNIPEQYLEQIFSKLKKANLIKSVRGAQGGYLLSRKASEITVYDVLTVLEGPVSISDCLLDKDSCENSDSCVTKLVWEKMRDAMDKVMKSITLCDMVNNYNETHNINRLENDIYCLMNNEIKK